jgi:hypothetical protein
MGDSKVELWGKRFSKQEILQRVGDISQIGGVRGIELRDGNEAGVAAIDFSSGSGLNFTVLPARGMDISRLEFKDIPLAWRSSTGEVGPWYHEASPTGWSRGFFGGLLATCGLAAAGHASVDQGQEFPLHGRASYIPARNVMFDGDWDGDDYIMWAQGRVRETVPLGENLCLTRKVWCKMGEKALHIRDTVENMGFEPAAHMLVYHMNFGFPLLDAGTLLVAPAHDVIPWDITWDQMLGAEMSRAIHEASAREIERYNAFAPPQPHYVNRVYNLVMAADENDDVTVALLNRGRPQGDGIGLYLKYSRSTLPEFTLWKVLQHQSYVVGLEPGNCRQGGRAAERAQGRLKMLEPAETVTYELEVGVLETEAEFDELEDRIATIRSGPR